MKKLILLALAVVSGTMFALPAIAAAGAPEADCPGGAATCKFTSSAGTSTFTTSGGTTIPCTKNTGSGEYTSKTTGTIALTFHGCTDPLFGSSCTSAGQPAGTIKTNTAVFHNIYTTDNKTSPGMLITQPAAGSVANFSCSGLMVDWTGEIIGDLETPGCGAESETWGMRFEQTAHGSQEHKQVTGTGAFFDPKWDMNTASEPTTVAMKATWTIKFAGKARLTCV